jgi:pSer/pThr/pTyr-binding forkhead associated (FHA) protein
MTVQSEEELEARLAAERLGIPFLVYRDGDEAQQIFALEPGRRSVTIGRRDEADISLPWDPECSRLHAELELRAGEWTISDDGLSQNGTWVNELRLYGRRRLADGDIVRIGRTLITFSRPGALGMGPTLVPGELSATPRFSEQQQRILKELCRPLFGDGEGVTPTSDEDIAASLGMSLETVATELDHLTRALGLESMPHGEGRAEVALLALRSGLVGADENG